MKRKVLFLMAATLMMTAAAYSQVSFGLRAGVNFQNLNGEDEAGDKLKNDLAIGFHIGANAEIPIAQDFYIQPGLLFSTKGATNVYEVDDLKASISYIELPIHFLYKPQLGSGKLIVGFGPYVGYGIGGKFKLDDEEEDIKFKNDVKESDEEAIYLRPLDAGADIFFGYEFAFKVSVQLNAQLGLLNLVPKYEGEKSDEIVKNTGFGFSVGYRF
ncbi:MAG: PorT family protein [Bacteroidales bacterium]|nr:PorT family protein [Bacteroidales bacterium]